MPDKFAVSQSGRYWIVTDTQTGAIWPYLGEAAAEAAAAASNEDPTHMRDTNQTSAPPTIA